MTPSPAPTALASTGTTNFSDVIKNSFLENFSGSLTLGRVLLTLAVAFALGLFVCLIYKKTFSGVLYSHSFGLSLIMLSMVTALVLLPVTSNLTLSLGMVGALSIVRFRTAVKDPIDTTYMFWAIAVGICVGASFYLVAVVGSLAIGVLMLGLSFVRGKGRMPYLLVLRHSHDASRDVRAMMTKLPKYKVKSRTVSRDCVEMTLELNISDDGTAIINNFLRIPGVENATLVSYQGDYVS